MIRLRNKYTGLGAVGIGMAFLCMNTSSSGVAKCDKQADHILVLLAHHTLSVPLEDHPLIQNHDLTVGECYREGDTPVKATFVSVAPKVLIKKYDNETVFKNTKEGFSLSIGLVDITQYPNMPPQDIFSRFIKPELDTNRQAISDLPQIDSIPVLKKTNGIRYYILNEQEPISAVMCSPKGSQAALQCGGAVILKPDIQAGFNYLPETYVPASKLEGDHCITRAS